MKKTLSSLLGLLGISCSFATPVPPWTGNTMTSGISAMTCISSGDQSPAGLNEHVLAFADLRDPVGCGATPINTPPTEWVLPNTRMYYPPPSANDWSVRKLGEVFGVDVAVGNASHVYVSSLGPKVCNWGGLTIWNNRPYHTANNNTGNGGEVWRIDGSTHMPLLLANLPNHKGYFQGAPAGMGVFHCINGMAFVGLGQVSVNNNVSPAKVYVSNLDDGKIYTLNDGVYNSVYPCVFDHGATKPSPTLADDTTLLYTQKARMVFGLEYHQELNRLFYVLRNAVDQDEVWSLALDSAGCPTGAQCLEFTSPSWTATPMAGSLPSDIQFSADGCRMLITHLSIRWEAINVSNIVPAFTGPSNQPMPLRWAHTSTAYEAKINGNPACNPSFQRWTYLNGYDCGLPYYSGGAYNAIAGDYGYGSLLATPAQDSVVIMCDVIRQSFTASNYKFGPTIIPLGDFNRSLGNANFDVPLLSGNAVVGATKIQLCDIDVLHRAACDSMPQSGQYAGGMPGGTSGAAQDEHHHH